MAEPNASEKLRFNIFLTAVIAALITLLTLAPGAFKVLAFSFALAYLFDPMVDTMERLRIPRTVSIGLIMVFILAFLAVLLVIFVPFLWRQGIAFVEAAPGLIEGALEKLEAWGVLRGEIPRSLPQMLDGLREALVGEDLSAIKPLAGFLIKTTSGAMGFLLGIINVVVIPVFFFFIIRDIDHIKEKVFRFVPSSRKGTVENSLAAVDRILGGFIRGQIMVALALAVLYSTGLFISGVRFGVVIGVLSGLLSVIPYVGFMVGMISAGVILMVDFLGWFQVLGVALTFMISQAIEGYILTPRFVGNRVGLNPLETLVVVLVGGEIGGFFGLLVAIPAGGIVKEAFLSLHAERK